MAKSGATSPTLKALSAAGVLAAALIGLSANVLAARFYERWDWTSQGLYTLSPATVETLHDLQEPVDVVVFLSASDPLSVSVRNMLTAYGAETRQLKTRFVDPDRNPAEFLALQQKYGIITGKTEDGRVVTDAAIVVARGDRHWYVTSDDIVSYDESDNRAKPKLEQALTEAIRNVLQKESTTICFSAGHQEISIDDGGPNGLGELRYRLEKNNYRVVTLDLGAPKPDVALDECRVVVVAGPQVEVPANVTSRLSKWFSGGGNVLVLANPILDEDNRIRPTGLEPLTRTAGIELNADFVVEQDDKLRLPTGLGESFFATPKEHAITAGLFRAGEPRFRVLVSAAQSLRASGKQPVSLLVTSAEAVAVKDIRPFVEQGKAIEKGAGKPGPFVLAFASELPKQGQAPHGPRMVVVGSANLAWSRNWREPTLLGNRLFMESAVSWLAARPAIVSVPEKASHDVGLSLTEESLTDVRNYVLLYMPASAAALGIFVMLRRRSKEKRSRRKEKDEKES
ncbi:MAG: GldG family protein [Myxococcales bacterium]|nr:GldG family protein [Myxococcales bacterium]MCB9579401.1 GldG family protein [Polyangiaceae bacterium]